ncbi:SSL2 DNA or RNA helicases of superfamily II [uncultured Caudovirales phage]|uniref:SSL2 DNA or RNA helicases of superfamily II n=1 Tax=uncultured Caudovirales phage TaxID=2100421 RepID=A0A6J7WVD6_9CAUD|nr:SSL2 DNA or RNA helicases of superfamily II [uncultured Caudovirales phage]
MADIAIKKKNDVYLTVQSDPSIGQELVDHFSFDAPGAKFHPLFRNKVWDGKIRLFSMFTKELYVGLKSYLEHFAEVNQYTIDYSEYIHTADTVTPEEVKEFVDALNLSLPDNGAVREYQLDAIFRAISDGRRLLLSPTGSGKSLIIYCLLRWNQRFGRRQLILVPTTSLVEQMYADFQSYSQNNGWKASECCSKIYSGYSKENLNEIVISTWQSVYELPKKFFEGFQVVYGDEAHTFKAKSLTGIMHKMVNTPYRIGTTGTLDGTKTHKLVLEGLFGSVYKVTSTKQLMDDNQLAELKIFGLVLQYPDDVKKACKDNKYPDEMDFLCSYEPRNKFIRNLALNQKGNSLVLFQYVEKHGTILFDMIKAKAGDRKVFFVFGGTETADREDIRRITEKENDAIIVASYGTFSTGINIRNLHNIIFASPTKSKIRNLQSVGRGLRKGDDKTHCNLYDIGDDLTWKARKNYTLLHMIERIKTYNDEHFDYKLVKVSLNVL